MDQGTIRSTRSKPTDSSACSGRTSQNQMTAMLVLSTNTCCSSYAGGARYCSPQSPLMQRNAVVHQGKRIPMEGREQDFWTRGLQQLRAVAKREQRRPSSKVDGTRLRPTTGACRATGVDILA
ncbi:uncharacterized protein PITG_01078 [Phytophthora infestans T30-4]|uniref:Uncharacterized protein n=2 Tax=Phytophthora infestans TaxID=4787 RepID=D0MSE3_PHYIT|nr:uncharacterized protein PITG_01078 [Phytophthora infestans T30-4]EEY58412.1 hypothetical protein PITG_01078 [Phytophthora infestans T30-4]KAF4044376.1 hypothetical protein GN244_ATG03266 [Phytophthora infestans]|eukprot:XP_002909598.1 hypothetical protein PITG_01078 [Phytophthora infestans T30-4]